SMVVCNTLSGAANLHFYRASDGAFGSSGSWTQFTGGSLDGESLQSVAGQGRILGFDTLGNQLVALGLDGTVDYYAPGTGGVLIDNSNTTLAASGPNASETWTNLVANNRILGVRSSFNIWILDPDGSASTYLSSTGAAGFDDSPTGPGLTDTGLTTWEDYLNAGRSFGSFSDNEIIHLRDDGSLDSFDVANGNRTFDDTSVLLSGGIFDGLTWADVAPYARGGDGNGFIGIVVPEPSSAALFVGLAAVTLVFTRRRG
ncbi:MAG: PEP-CTERM sorting domain-containing protein, partial [Verrucomicrobiota bacterium]